MSRDIRDVYFEWLVKMVYPGQLLHRKLLMRLHSIEFTYSLPNDKHRAEDAYELRDRFLRKTSRYKECVGMLEGPCSVFEMMVALAVRCEETIMDDPAYGDRRSQWFWGMVVNLGLGNMNDDRFDRAHVDEAVNRFLNREYEANGKGGLFYVRGCNKDLRTVEIWYQLCWYLDSIT